MNKQTKQHNAMNKQDRAKLHMWIQALDLETKIGAIEEALPNIEEMEGAENDKADNLPEGLSGTDKGEAIAAAAEQLSEIRSNLETARDAMQDALNAYEEIRNL